MKLFIFGSTGDLVKRKIIPAFVDLNVENLEIIALGRKEFTDEMYHSFICDGDCFKNFKVKPKYAKINFDGGADFSSCDPHLEKSGENFFYSAMPPANIPDILKYLGKVKAQGFAANILIEKPFGMNLAEAESLKKLAEEFNLSENIFVSDHYLFKDEVLKLRECEFKKLKIVSLEAVGLEKRLTYYDSAGALKDMIQGHFLNIAFKLMKNPEEEFAGVEILEYVRGQYGNGRNAGYVKDLGKPSDTETFARAVLRTESHEFEFITGKRFDKKLAFMEIDSERLSLESGRNPYERLFTDFFAKRKGNFAAVGRSILGWKISEKIEAKKPALKYYDEGASVFSAVMDANFLQ